jgi:hypothetical protein
MNKAADASRWAALSSVASVHDCLSLEIVKEKCNDEYHYHPGP